MDTTKAVALFEKNWFLRDLEIPDLTDAERQLIATAMRPDPKPWEGSPDAELMARIVAAEPQVLDRMTYGA